MTDKLEIAASDSGQQLRRANLASKDNRVDSALLLKLLERLQTGGTDARAVFDQIDRSGDPAKADDDLTAATADAHVDLDRRQRCGFAEVVYCEGKSTESIIQIFEAQQTAGQGSFGTRVSTQQGGEIMRRFPNACYNDLARTVRMPHGESGTELGTVTVITAGTSDRPVAEEAVETLRWMCTGVELVYDVGVAGPHRLAEHRDRFQDADAVVVVAGMEGALPSVVGGYVACPVVAVPTSVGYGASFGGVAALLGMLISCASNVTVVNIDAGFKGGYVAGLIASRAAVGRSELHSASGNGNGNGQQ